MHSNFMSEKVEIWETVESREIADCRVFRVSENLMRSDGKEGKFYVIDNPDWVNIIAVTKKGEIVLIEQFRHGIKEVVLEIPGGMIDAGEEPEIAARRELLEETGYTAENFVLLGKSRPNPAIQNNWLYHYAAFDAAKTGEVNFDEHESLVTRLYSSTAISEMIKSGAISHSLVLAAFHYFSFYTVKD
jgi:8-oxo-dGTP pyrophosphatase MutT (NUDIX family)